jgi:hypothetical protein
MLMVVSLLVVPEGAEHVFLGGEGGRKGKKEKKNSSAACFAYLPSRLTIVVLDPL